MARVFAKLGWVAAAGLMLALPACSGADPGNSNTGSPAAASEEEPLDPLDGDESELQLGKADAAKRVLPPFDSMWGEYPHGTADEVKDLIGGNVDADWITNTCTIRVSRALNYSGFLVPGSVTGLNTVRGEDNLRYAFRVAEMRRYFKTVLGTPTIVGLTREEFVGRRGVIVFEVSGWSDATGHFDLWDGEKCAHQDYFDKASKVQLWEAK